MSATKQNKLNIELAHHLASYLPVTLVRQMLRDGLPTPGVPYGLDAATLFADVSGFTAMSEELATDGPRGAEELHRVLLTTFTAMVTVIHQWGGAISHYYGDAMSVYFPDEDGRAAQRALCCAQEMQQLMTTSLGRAVTNRPPDKEPIFMLTIKIGLGYGRCQSLIVGDVNDSMEFVLAGEGVDDATNAEKEAGAGQIIASRAILEQAGLTATAEYALFAGGVERPPATPILRWSEYTDTAVNDLIPLIYPFVPDALIHRFSSAGVAGLAEHRPATSIFVQVDFLGDEDDTSAIETAVMGRQMQDYYTWVSQLIRRFSAGNAQLNRVLTGDKGNQIHIIFGAPVAPDAPVQAVRCALALIAEQPDYIATQRIGLTVGKLFAGLVGSATRQEYTLAGSIVNLAARLMQQADAGVVLLDAATAARVSPHIETVPLPARSLKGFQEPVPLHQAVDEQRTTQIQTYLQQWSETIVNRVQEQTLLLDGVQAALRGRGSVAAVSGPTGVGKSHLLAIGVRHWLEAGGTGWMGVCYQHLAETPYAPWRDVWREMFALSASMSVAQQVTAVIEKTKALAPEYMEDVGLWREALGLPIPQSALLAEMPPEVRQARLFALVRTCLRAMSRIRPLLIVLEDCHWADRASLALLDELALHLEDEAILTLLTHQPSNRLVLKLFDRPSFIPIVLADLSANHARELLGQLVGTTQLPLAVERHLGMRDRDGRDSPVNPLFLAEAVNVMVDSGVLIVGEQVQVDEVLLGQVQLPDTIHGLLLERLDRLSPAGRDLLQVASVIGRQFELQPLRILSHQATQPAMLDLLTELSQAEMTRLVTTDPDWVYLFQHAMTHEVAYESMPYARRQTLHALVADWLVNFYAANLKPYYAVIAYHYGRATDHEAGLKYALLAADEAKAAFANQDAVDLYTVAEEHLDTFTVDRVDELWETAVHIHLSRAEALRFTGDFSEAIADAEQASQIAQTYQDHEQTAQAVNLLAELKCRQAEFDETLELTAKLITNTGEQISTSELARAYQWSGMAYASQGNYENALEHLFKAEELCLYGQNNERLARILETMAFVYYSQKQLPEAADTMERSIVLSRNVSIPANVASSLSNVALVQLQLGKAKNALQSIDEAIKLSSETSKNFYAQVLGNRAEILAYLGRISEAKESYNKAIPLLRTMGDEYALIEVYLSKSLDLHATLQEWKETEYWLLKAQRLIEHRQDLYSEKSLRVQIGQGLIALKNNDLVKSWRILNEAESQIIEGDYGWWYPQILYLKGVVKDKQQDTIEAKIQYLLGLDSIIRKEGCPDYKPLLLLELYNLETDEEKKIEYLLECAVSAENRAKEIDRQRCLTFVSKKLLLSKDPQLLKLGLKYKSFVSEWK